MKTILISVLASVLVVLYVKSSHCYRYIHFEEGAFVVTKKPPIGYSDFSDMTATNPYYYKYKCK